MKLAVTHIHKAFKGLALLMALCFLVAQPILENTDFLKVPIFEMVQNETEDDTEEEDRQERESEDEKMESIIIQPFVFVLDYACTFTSRKRHEVILQISMDIHIPPPDRTSLSLLYLV